MANTTIRALVFDVFGTVVDWRCAILDELAALSRAQGKTIDGARFIESWERARRPSMDAINAGAMPWTNVSAIYRRRLDDVLVEFGLDDMGAAQRDHLNRAWCRPRAWPDSVPALLRLKKKFTLATLTNVDFAWSVAMAKHAGLPWDAVVTAEVFKRYKPAPETYLGVMALLGVRPEETMMIACHNYDLAAAASHGMKTAFIPRKEFSDDQTKDQAPERDWTIAAKDLGEVADRLGA